MKRYKVIYYIGNSVDIKTVVNEGFLFIDGPSVFIISKDQKSRIQIEQMKSVSLFMLNGLGSMLKVHFETKTLFISVYRFSIDGQFAMTNFFGTRQLKKDLLIHLDPPCHCGGIPP